MNRRKRLGKLAKERAWLFLSVLIALLLATPAAANTPDLTDLQINYQALVGTSADEPADPRFSPFKPPPFPASSYRLISPESLLDLDLWARAQDKTRLRGFDLGLWAYHQGKQWFKWEIAAGDSFARNRLGKITVNGEIRGIYTYDYQDLRTSKVGGPEGMVRYHYDDQSVLLQTSATGEELARYDYGADRLLSLYYVGDDEIDAGREWYLFDGMGSIVNTVKPDLSTTTRSKWDAWGNSRGGTGDTWNTFGYTGHEHDENTGLIYAKARFYDPDVGRFLSEDPFGGYPDTPPSLHKYLYAYGNPTVYTDPTGEIPELRELIDKVKDVTQSLDKAREAITSSFGDEANVDTTSLAILSGLGDWVAGGLEGVNKVANYYAASFGQKEVEKWDPEYRKEFYEEFNAQLQSDLNTLETAKKFGKLVIENPEAAGAAVLDAGIEAGNELAARLFQGGEEGQFELVKFSTKVAVNVAAIFTGNVMGELGSGPRMARSGSFFSNALRDLKGLRRGSTPDLVRSRVPSQGSYRPGDLLPNGRIAGNGPGAALGNGPDFNNGSVPDIRTGMGYGAGDLPVRIEGDWSINDLKQGLLGHPPRGLGSPDLHHGGQMPGAAKHEALPVPHRSSKTLHPNRYNQGVTPEMRVADRQLHWWYRAREQGADVLLPDWIYDD